jgi:SAM-dependent methyltransferase
LLERLRRVVTHAAKATLPFELRFAVRRLDWAQKYMRGYAARSSGRKYCPIAQREFRHFARDRGGGLITPTNGAKARHRLIWLYIERETTLLRGNESLLHVAPERCLFDRFIAVPRLHYVPGDRMGKGYGKQAGVRELDLLAIDFPAATFDHVLCNHVLEHIEADTLAMREIFRVLKPGGSAIVTIPMRDGPTIEDPSATTPAQRKRLFGQWDHVRLYGDDISERLAACGFEVHLERYAREFSEAERARLGLDETVIVIARKPVAASTAESRSAGTPRASSSSGP